MDPWIVIGWLLLAVCVVVPAMLLALAAVIYAAGASRRYLAYRRSRNTAPEAGQLWAQASGHLLEVVGIRDSGSVRIRSSASIHSSSSWSETPAVWESRRHSNRRYLVPE